MSRSAKGLVKRKNREAWYYDFKLGGHRFHGSTGHASRREAEIWLKKFRQEAEAGLVTDVGKKPMTFLQAATRWWEERGQLREDRRDQERHLAWLQANIGGARLIKEIDNDLIARLVVRRRGEGVANSTINRSATEPLRAILKHAEFLGQDIQRIAWGRHLLKEPPPRVGEITDVTEEMLISNLREDLRPIIRFLLATGVRRREAALLEWKDVDLQNEAVVYHLKGGRIEKRPISTYAADLLRDEMGKHPTQVFCYRAERKHKRHGRDEWVPISLNYLDTLWTRLVTACKVKGIRKHDLRHTALSRVTRVKGLLVAQRVAGHRDIKTTMRYAHAAETDIRDALNAIAPAESHDQSHDPSRRGHLREA